MNFMKPKQEKKQVRIGDIRTAQDGTKEVLICTNQEKAETELSRLERIIRIVNLERLPDLKQIGLADNVGEICMNCNLTPDGLITNLATKMLNTGKVNDEIAAKCYAREKVNEAIKAGRIKVLTDDLNLLTLSKSGVIVQYRDFVRLTNEGLEVVNKEAFKTQFENWESGPKAEKFHRLQELTEEFNAIINHDIFQGIGNVMHFFNFNSGNVQLDDNWSLEVIAD